MVTQDEKTWGMLLHLGNFLGIIIPFGGLIAPLAIWLIKRDQSAFINKQGFVWLNAMVSYLIYGVISAILALILIGVLLAIVLAVIAVIETIRAAIRAHNGEDPKNYFLAINFFGH